MSDRPAFTVELVPRDPLWKTALLSVICERLGFDGLWVSDHFFNRNVFIALTEIAHRTRRIMLGPAVVNPYLHHPVTIAQMVATLHELAEGRVRLAVGAGDSISLSRIGIKRYRPLERVAQCVKTVRDLLSGKTMTNLRLEIPATVCPPIFVGAQGRRMMEVAVEVADGVLVNWSNLQRLRESSKIVAARLGGRDGFTLGAHLIVSIHEDPAKARKTAVPFAAYLMVGSSEDILDSLGVSANMRDEVARCLTAFDWERLYSISGGEWVDYFSIWGTPARLEEDISVILEMGYNEIVFGGPLGPRPYTAIRTISKIIGRLKRG
jgi:5,10-methylenetetrahydromethanopterin reductase